MNINESIFACKLYEMEEQYGKLQCRIRACEYGGRDKIRTELEQARKEYAENTLLMEEKTKSCRSPAVTKLTQAQLEYRRKIDELKKQIVSDLHSDENSPEEDKREAGMLYAEFAMDFATLTMQQALISALTALEGQSGKTYSKDKIAEEAK
ncbi:MAG TPA: hypothetical protein IAA12_00025 [Candidatus Blautia intestinipullorum]|nr:hypothetical protein [Candidatus Blautia intestinipullorum]